MRSSSPPNHRVRVRALATIPRTYESSSELTLAIQMFRRALPAEVELSLTRGSADIGASLHAAVAQAVADEGLEYLLVARDPALLPGPGTITSLIRALDEQKDLDAVMPSELRDHGQTTASYMTLYQFERFASALQARPLETRPYDGRKPWVCLLRRAALQGRRIPAEPLDVLGAIADRCAIVLQAFVHPFADYYAQDRSECLQLVPTGVGEVLDIGCAGGDFGAALKAARGCRVVGIELHPEVAEKARERLDAVIVGDALEVQLPERFDCVTCLDTLEHLAEPERLLRRVAGEFLKPGGFLLLSIPNIGHWSVIETLLAGRWDYVPAGVLCQTHLRFFTLSSIRTTLAEGGFEIAKLVPLVVPLPDGWRGPIEGLERWIEVDRDSLQTAGYHVLAQVGRGE